MPFPEPSSNMKFVFLAFVLVMLFTKCNDRSDEIMRIAGRAQGTTYHISWRSKDKTNYHAGIDSLLKEIDSSLSTYVPSSVISRINNNDSTVHADKYFAEVFEKAIEISQKTEGHFDVTVGPVINAWGFGFSKRANIDSATINSLLQFVGYSMVRLEDQKVVKAKPQVMIDFNAIAQGYSVDLLASYLENKGVENYLVELGGEVKAKGRKNNQEYWKVGIDQPNETATEERPLKAIINLKDKALATSGNYRKFYIENGKKYAHIIDPKTGYPAKHNLLSATVIADDCMTADAYATAFMVMGLEKSKEFLLQNKELGLEAYFIYEENGAWQTYSSEALKQWLHELP